MVMWFNPDGSVSYSQVPPWPGPAPRRKSRWHWVLLPVAAILSIILICTGWAAGLIVVPQPQWVAGSGSGGGQAGGVVPEGVKSPSPDDPPSVRTEYLDKAIQLTLNKQSAALLAGDESDFLAPADVANQSVRDKLRNRYAALHGMSLGVWEQSISGYPKPQTDGSVLVNVRQRYCMGDASCRPVLINVETRWRDDGGNLRMTDIKPSTRTSRGPRPWEVTELTVATGQRVVVAGPTKYASRIRAMVTAADRAAAKADRFAKWVTAPSRYVIYLAGSTEWRSWYSSDEPDWAAAYAIPVSDEDSEVVVNASRVSNSEVEELLTHELTHVTTLAGALAFNSPFWLVEGIGDYSMWSGKSVKTYAGIPYVRKFAKSSRWRDDPVVAGPAEDASVEDAAARYGIAFLDVRRMAERYGEDKMLDFFGLVARDGESVESASQKAFSLTWPAVSADLAKYIRNI